MYRIKNIYLPPFGCSITENEEFGIIGKCIFLLKFKRGPIDHYSANNNEK